MTPAEQAAYLKAAQERYTQKTGLNPSKPSTPTVSTPTVKTPTTTTNTYQPQMWTSAGGKQYEVYDPSSGQPYKAGQVNLVNQGGQGSNQQYDQNSNSDYISQQAQQQKNSMLAALKQRIAESQASQKQLISKAPQTYDPLKASSEVAKAEQLRTALERSSLQGDRGGIGRSTALATQTAGENRLGAINLQQSNVISGAEAEIARLENEGKFQEAQIIADLSSQEIQNQLAERNRVDAINRQDTIRSEDLALQERLRAEDIAREDATTSKKDAAQVSELERQDFFNTIGQFPDIQAEINKIANDNDTTNDWKLPYLRTARQEKLQGIEQSQQSQQLAEQQAQSTASKEAYDRAFEIAKATNRVTAETSKILGLPVGYFEKKQYAPKITSSGGSSSGTTTSKTGVTQFSGSNTEQYRQFEAAIVDAMQTSPSAAKQAVIDNKDTIVKLKGIATYNKLIKQAEDRMIQMSGGRLY